MIESLQYTRPGRWLWYVVVCRRVEKHPDIGTRGRWATGEDGQTYACVMCQTIKPDYILAICADKILLQSLNGLFNEKCVENRLNLALYMEE